MDDGSVEDLRPLARRFGRAYPLRIDRQPPRGVSAARNRAIRLARARLLALHDDDLVPRREFVAACLAFHAAHPADEDAALLYFEPDRAIARDLLVRWAFWTTRVYPFPTAAGVYNWHYFWSGALTCKKRIFRHGLFDRRYRALEDTELAMRLSRRLDLRIHFDRTVRSTYVRRMTFVQLYRRTYAMAYYTGVFARDYPRTFRIREAVYRQPERHRMPEAELRAALATVPALQARLERQRHPGRTEVAMLCRLWYVALDHALATGWLDARRRRRFRV